MLRLFSALLCVVALLPGCSKSNRKPVYSTTGIVLDAAGQPVPSATIVFHPANEIGETEHRPAARTDQQGKFTLTTYNKDDGAPAGEYVVTVVSLVGSESPRGPAPPDRFQGKFVDPHTSPLRSTIEPRVTVLEIRLP